MKKKILISIIILLIITVTIKIISSKTYFSCEVKPSKDYKQIGNISYDEYLCLLNSNKPIIIMFTQSNCSFCKDFKPIINKYAEKNKVPVYALEVNTVNATYNEITSQLPYFKKHETWGTPLTLAIKEKQILAKMTGYTKDEYTLNDFFKELKK